MREGLSLYDPRRPNPFPNSLSAVVESDGKTPPTPPTGVDFPMLETDPGVGAGLGGLPLLLLLSQPPVLRRSKCPLSDGVCLSISGSGLPPPLEDLTMSYGSSRSTGSSVLRCTLYMFPLGALGPAGDEHDDLILAPPVDEDLPGLASRLGL